MCQCQVNSVGIPPAFRGMSKVSGVGFGLTDIGGLIGGSIGGATGDIIGAVVNTGVKIGLDIGTQSLIDELGFGGQKTAVGGTTKAVTGTSGNTLVKGGNTLVQSGNTAAPANDNTPLILGGVAVLAAILLIR